MSQIRVILGAQAGDIERLRYPLFASYKLDGIRAFKYGPELFSRTFKCIPNRALRRLLVDIPSGTDGELIFGEPTAPDVYRKTVSAVMRENGESTGIRFFVFDNREHPGGFAQRFERLPELLPHVVRLDHEIVRTPSELRDFEEKALQLGYEGVVLRDPKGVYKPGRSTLREQYLLKLKRYHDAEAIVVGFEELLRNENEATLDKRGYTKRSSHQEGKIPANTLGALVCQMGDRQFRIGTGFTQLERDTIWRDRAVYFGKLAKFKSFPIGVKERPRHPVFLGWREEMDK